MVSIATTWERTNDSDQTTAVVVGATGDVIRHRGRASILTVTSVPYYERRNNDHASICFRYLLFLDIALLNDTDQTTSAVAGATLDVTRDSGYASILKVVTVCC